MIYGPFVIWSVLNLKPSVHPFALVSSARTAGPQGASCSPPCVSAAPSLALHQDAYAEGEAAMHNEQSTSSLSKGMRIK